MNEDVFLLGGARDRTAGEVVSLSYGSERIDINEMDGGELGLDSTTSLAGRSELFMSCSE